MGGENMGTSYTVDINYLVLILCSVLIQSCSSRGIGIPISQINDDPEPQELYPYPDFSEPIEDEDDLMSLPPLFRGKKAASSNFFPLPNGYYNRKVFIKTRNTRNIPRPDTREKIPLALPWTMKYFSPMLRG